MRRRSGVLPQALAYVRATRNSRELFRLEGAALVVVVGIGVARALGDRLSEVRSRRTVVTVPQPNARLSSADHHKSFRTYYHAVREANMLA